MIMQNLIWVLFFSFFTACNDAKTDQSDLDTIDAASNDLPAKWRDDMLTEVNALRKKGCKCPDGVNYPPAPLLKRNTKLDKSANAHAADMNKHDFFSHTGSDGSKFSTRFTRAGYEWSNAAENIAYNYASVPAVVKGWRESAGHCHNMMNPTYKEIGSGKVGAYWVQDLGTQME
jgi:uncharacterized protein YkwD